MVRPLLLLLFIVVRPLLFIISVSKIKIKKDLYATGRWNLLGITLHHGSLNLSLRNKTVSGVKWTSLSMVIVTVTQLLQLVILARFLSPVEFGLMAIMMVVIGFSQAFMDMGISNAIIHRQQISHTQLSSLYWLNIFSGLVLFCIVFLLAPLIAGFYEEPGLLEPLMWLSSVFIIVAIGNQYRILCQKELQFNLMAKVEMTAAVVSLTVAVVLAIKGFGVYALVGAMLAQASVSSLLFLIIGFKQHHRPAFVYHHRDLKGFYSFGLYQMGERSINYIGTNVDKLLIGKFVGMEATGFYNMAWHLIIYPVSKINPVINKVAFPVYAKVQENSEALNRYYSLTVRALSLVTVPILAFLGLHSSDVVLVVFGEGWETTATLVAFLSLIGILRALGNPGGAIVLALGHAHAGFLWNLFWVPLIFISLYVALNINPSVEVVPMVLLGLSLTFGWGWHFMIAYYAKIRYLNVALHFLKIMIVCFVIAWLSKELINALDISNAFVRLAIAGLVCGLLYLPYLYLFENEILSLARKGK
ncbi:MAG: MOP flippase family protein [Methyloprofundus sp.]|nr:MOP flippase family protein [Methyloprofundus sp.]